MTVDQIAMLVTGIGLGASILCMFLVYLEWNTSALIVCTLGIFTYLLYILLGVISSGTMSIFRVVVGVLMIFMFLRLYKRIRQ